MRTLSVLALALLVAGCDLTSDGPRDLPAVDASAAVAVETAGALAAARDAWAASGIDSYELRYERACFCAGSVFQVRVEDGQVVTIWVDDTSGDFVTDAVTIDRLFGIAIDAFGHADTVSARVLPGAPFLYSVSVDYDEEIADEEVSYTLTGFEALD